jgi:hypothetical protein
VTLADHHQVKFNSTGNHLLVKEYPRPGAGDKPNVVLLSPDFLKGLDKYVGCVLSESKQDAAPTSGSLHMLNSDSKLPGGVPQVLDPKLDHIDDSLGCPVIETEDLPSFCRHSAMMKQTGLIHTAGSLDWSPRGPMGPRGSKKLEEWMRTQQLKSKRYGGSEVGFPNWECVSGSCLKSFIL